MRIGLAQLCSRSDPWENLFQFQNFLEEARRNKVELLCFPENLFYRGPKSELPSEIILERNEDGQILETSAFAKELKSILDSTSIAVSLGSVLERNANASKPYNAHWFHRPNQGLVAYYKIHLFDFSGAQAQYKESNDYSAGSRGQTLEWQSHRFGLSICYDLRFPELYRNYSLKNQTEVILVPAAFTFETGQAHWHLLLRARAVENLSFVAAAAQWGSHRGNQGENMFCYGHSLIINPWGKILAEGAENQDDLVVADLNFDEMNQYRARLPALSCHRLGLAV